MAFLNMQPVSDIHRDSRVGSAGATVLRSSEMVFAGVTNISVKVSAGRWRSAQFGVLKDLNFCFSPHAFQCWGGEGGCQILDVICVTCYFKAIFKGLKTPVFLGQSPQKEPEVLKFSCCDGACSYSNLFRPNKCVGFVQITSAPLNFHPCV